jgi:hypothetical protein
MKSWVIPVLSLFWLVSGSQAADLRSLNQLFQERFYQDWEDNRCGENTARLVAAANQRRIDLSESVIIGAEDVMGYFGLISGYVAREGGSMIQPAPKQAPFRHPGRNNWYFHVFLVAMETVNPSTRGQVAVYDLSFRNQPTVLNLTRYLDQMYMPEGTFGNPNTRAKHLKSFQFSIYDARTYVTQGQSKARIKDKTYLRDLYPSYYRYQTPNDSEFFGAF